MNVTVESSGNLMIAYLIGELDHHSAGAVRDKIDSSISCMKPNHLILDFKNVEDGVSQGAPEYMEWYCAFGMMMTLVWLYLEMLRLLSKINRE